MKFSAKSEYALRALVEMVNRCENGPIGVKEIALKQGIPERFLEQQITALRKAGIIRSQRGAQGGVMLARAPEDITILEIIEALEGPPTAVGCAGSNSSDCAKNAQCAVQDLLGQLSEAIEKILRKTTLKELANRQGKYDQAAQLMYYI